MALVQCEECGNEISTKAATCPKCGAPGPGEALQRPTENNTVTTQTTGKGIKAQQAISSLLMVIALCVIFVPSCAGEPVDPGAVRVGVIMFVIGSVWLILAKFFGWWHHG